MTFIVRSLFLIAILSFSVQASLIQNSGFDQCADPTVDFCLDGFEVFADATDPNNPNRQSFVRNFPVDPTTTPGVFFNAGRLTFSIFGINGFEGGGLRQSFDFSGGDINIDIGYNVIFGDEGINQRGQIVATLFGPDGSAEALSDSFDFSAVSDPQDIINPPSSAQGNLNLQTSVTDLLQGGLYTLEIVFGRTFLLTDTLFGLTNISATSQTGGLENGSNELPEPGTLGILFIAIVGLVAMRHYKKSHPQSI
jgi:hypothetical protein